MAKANKANKDKKFSNDNNSSFILSPPVTTQHNNKTDKKELLLIIQSLRNEVIQLNQKVDRLDSKVINLESTLVKTEASLHVSQTTSENLRKELDRQQQYSRRNCIVIDGIKSSKNLTPSDHLNNVVETLTNEFSDEVTSSLDKAHTIGPLKNGKQSMIVRFTKHSTVKKIYNSRKTLKNKNISLRPSLTRSRSMNLQKCKQMIESSFSKSVNFVFADIEGNLKVCFKNPYKGRNIHVFNDYEELNELIMAYDHELDFNNDDIIPTITH